MTMALVSASASLEELLLPDARAYLRIDGDQDDAVLYQCLAAARGYLEGRDGIMARALLTQTWDWTFDCFPAPNCPLVPPLAPLQSVVAITTRSAQSIETIWPATEYLFVGGDGFGRILPAPGKTWPPVTAGLLDSIRVRFTAGYGSTLDLLPPSLRQGLIALAGDFYTNRDSASPPPAWVSTILEPYRLVRI